MLPMVFCKAAPLFQAMCVYPAALRKVQVSCCDMHYFVVKVTFVMFVRTGYFLSLFQNQRMFLLFLI